MPPSMRRAFALTVNDALHAGIRRRRTKKAVAKGYRAWRLWAAHKKVRAPPDPAAVRGVLGNTFGLLGQWLG